MTYLPTPPANSAGDLAAEALARLVVAAVNPLIDQKIAESERRYDQTLATHLEIIQTLGRRLDAQREAHTNLSDRLDTVADELADLILRSRLFTNKVNSLDGSRAGHQNNIAALFESVDALQVAMTEAESRILDIEEAEIKIDITTRVEIVEAQPETKPTYPSLADAFRLSAEQIRALVPELPPTFAPMATSYNYAGGDWLKAWDLPAAKRRDYTATPIAFDTTGVAYEPKPIQAVSSDIPPKSCNDLGAVCCGDNPCCYCGKTR